MTFSYIMHTIGKVAVRRMIIRRMGEGEGVRFDERLPSHTIY
jgi:hypothetical protein